MRGCIKVEFKGMLGNRSSLIAANIAGCVAFAAVYMILGAKCLDADAANLPVGLVIEKIICFNDMPTLRQIAADFTF